MNSDQKQKSCIFLYLFFCLCFAVSYMHTQICMYVRSRKNKTVNRYFRFVSGEKITRGILFKSFYPQICLFPFCSGSSAQKVKDTVMKREDLIRNRSLHLSMCWVSLFTAKKHLISKNILCQMKCLRIWNQSRGWALEL